MALEEVNRAKSLFPPPAPYSGGLIWQRGNILMCMEDWAEAEKEFRVLISDPGRREAFQLGFHRLGHLFKAQGKLETSIEMYKKGIETAKNEKTYNFEMMFNESLAYTYLESGNLTEALKASEEHTRLAVKFLPQPDFSIQFLKGYVCARTGAIKEAKNAADELKIMVDNGLSKEVIRYYYLLMGMIEFKADNYKEAERYQTQALLLLPFQAHSARSVDHALFYNALATTYLKLGELDKAQEQYEIITSLTRGRLGFGIIYAKSYYMLGKIHEQRGDSAKAIEYYERFLNLWKDADPGLPEVDDARKRLDVLKAS